jgi:hypothetical protein
MNDMDNRAGTRPAPTLGEITGAFKSITTNEYIRSVKTKNGHHSINISGSAIITNT